MNHIFFLTWQQFNNAKCCDGRVFSKAVHGGKFEMPMLPQCYAIKIIEIKWNKAWLLKNLCTLRMYRTITIFVSKVGGGFSVPKNMMLIPLRRPKKFAKSSTYFCPMQCQSKVRLIFSKILWPSQNIWTLFVRSCDANWIIVRLQMFFLYIDK